MAGGKISVVIDLDFAMDRLGVKPAKAGEVDHHSILFEAMAEKKNYHVTKRPEGWAVQREGGERASSLHRTQSEAIDAGRSLAQGTRGELRIHGRDNRIREGYSYGNDPHPPKG